MSVTPSSIIALDVGEQRVGVAIVGLVARLPRPLTTLQHDQYFFTELQAIVNAETPAAIVVGLPRGLDGQNTAQTRAVEAFAEELRAHLVLPVYFQDEALTSVKAEAELGANHAQYKKEDVDALAATYILEDFLESAQYKQEFAG